MLATEMTGAPMITNSFPGLFSISRESTGNETKTRMFVFLVGTVVFRPLLIG